jgi:uncharacterized membrane protein
MKKLLAVLAVGVLTTGIGCNVKGTSGGPGTTDPNKKTLGQEENTFSLSPPLTSITIKQGEKQNVKIGISRGKNFDQDVKLNFGELPKGISITPAHPTIAAGDKDTTVSVEATKEAAINDFTITVTGKPEKGGEAKNTFKIAVKKP